MLRLCEQVGPPEWYSLSKVRKRPARLFVVAGGIG
jgi:hypothetical protein